MQRKRKLTASFCEIPQEKDTLRRSWRTGEHSDWTLVLGATEFRIHKVIVATGDRASAFLAASFRKHCGKLERTDLTELVPRTCWQHFEALLDYMYSGDVSITVESWGALVKMADLMQIGALYTRCVDAGGDLISPSTAPRLVADAVELQLGGDLQQQVVQIAVDVMAPQFSSYGPKDLAQLPLQVFQALLRRDDLEVASEDQVFDFLMRLAEDLSHADMAQLWRCCRLHALSKGRVLEVAQVDDIPKQAVVWALSQRASVTPKTAPTPAWVQGFTDTGGFRGREITFLVQNPTAYASKRHLRSVAHQLCDKFKWRLLIFPLGTESTGNPRQVAAFVELVPEAGVDPGWSFKRVKYSITLVNWSDERRSITKEHVFDFCASEVDNGWHRGWVTPDSMTAAQGWLNEGGELCFRAQCCIKNATLSNVDLP